MGRLERMHFRIALALLWQRSSFFEKSPRPSLPLKRAPPLTPTLSPSGKREETAPPRRSEPLRSKVGGASKPSPWLCGMGPPGNSSL